MSQINMSWIISIYAFVPDQNNGNLSVVSMCTDSAIRHSEISSNNYVIRVDRVGTNTFKQNPVFADHTSTALITGVEGFIGSHLVEALVDQGYRVYGLDNCSTATRQNIACAGDHPAFTLTKGIFAI